MSSYRHVTPAVAKEGKVVAGFTLANRVNDPVFVHETKVKKHICVPSERNTKCIALPVPPRPERRVQSGADRGTAVPLLPVYHLKCFRWDSHLQAKLFCLFFICAALEGRAGMAAITLSKGRRFDSAAFYRHVVKFLPNYARPRFVRIQVHSVLSSICSAAVGPPCNMYVITVLVCRVLWTSQARSST